MTATERLQLRARDAVGECLTQRLILPTIYFEAEWPTPGRLVDLLAIDRAGTGDVHVVEAKVAPIDLKKAVQQLMSVPAQYRWLAVFSRRGKRPLWLALGAAPALLYPRDEMGRIGVIEVVRMADDSLEASIRFRAERFRGNLSKESDAFTSAHRPDIEFR